MACLVHFVSSLVFLPCRNIVCCMFERWNLWKSEGVCVYIIELLELRKGEEVDCMYSLQPNQKAVKAGEKR